MIRNSRPWQELAEVKQRIAERCWFPGTSGNLAIRYDNDSLLVTTSGVDKYITNERSFTHVANDGTVLSDGKPSLETLLHLEVFKTDANVSLHVHTVNNNVISELYGNEGEVRFKNQELIKAFGLWNETDELVIPIIENPADIPELTELFKAHIHGGSGIVLIRNHGINVWGKDSAEAFKFLEASEFLFEYHLKLRQFGGDNYDNNHFAGERQKYYRTRRNQIISR